MFSESFSGEVVVGENKQVLAERLAADVAAWLAEGIKLRGEAILVVSGGSTPGPFFKSLSEYEINWSKVKVTLADERWVAPDDKLSNEKFVRESLLINAAAAASFVPIYNKAKTPDDGWSLCEDTLNGLSLPFDVVVLGMGDDGHTASLFPNTKGLDEASDLTTHRKSWPMYPVHLTEARMTLTLAALLDCRQLVLHMTGDNKLELFNRVVDGAVLPIASVTSAAKERLQVYWAS